MNIYTTCSKAISSCKETGTFAIAHLYSDETAMKIHIHDTYEIYYSISGGKQFLIDDRFYDFMPGDMFLINQYESHYLSQLDSATHERIVISVDPSFLIACSTEQTDLNYCFSHHDVPLGHRISLSSDEQAKFMLFVHAFQEHGTGFHRETAYGEDILDKATFLEMMLFINRTFRSHNEIEAASPQRAHNRTHHRQVDEIISYINQHITEDLTINTLADQFYMSSSGICKIFKDTTGTTLNRYITAKRITLAKEYLAQGQSVTDTCMNSGFRDYSNFLKAFSKAVGITPKKYAAMSQ